ncbi:MAG: peptidylprolyl isomerase [Candidatus Cloacimonadaceae bacterium]|nr:peptidylprolyl isomerase [Candidatus Cloacimonadaceae bacterium]
MKRIILALIILLMALLTACSVNQGPLAGKVNGTPIPYDEFIAANRGHYENFWVQNSRAPGIDEKQEITRQTWRNITKHVILKDYFKAYNIRVTPQEMIDTLRTSVPHYLMTSPRFMVNGVFDKNLYLQSLLYDTPENLMPIRKHYYEYLIPIMKLKDELIERKMLTKKERASITQVLAGKADIDWVIVDAAEIKPIVSESEITQYYQKNLDNYRMDDSFALSHIVLPVKPGPEDLAYADSVMDSIYAEILNGETPATVVEKHRTHYPNIYFKNSGFLRNADLEPKLYATLSAIKEGEFSPPIETDGIYTIYHLEQLTKSMTSYNTVTLVAMPRSASIRATKNAAERIVQMAQTIGMENAADEMSLKLIPSKNLKPESVWIDDPLVRETVFKGMNDARHGHIFAPIYSAPLSAWVIVQVTDNQLNRVRPLSAVRNDIIAILSVSKRLDIAQKTAGDWLAKQNTARPDISTLPYSTLKSTTAMSFDTSLANLDPKIVETDPGMIYYKAVRRYLDKAAPQIYVSGNQVLIPFVRNHTVAKNASVAPILIRETYKKTLPDTWFDTWLEDQIRQARVSIYVNM